MSVELTMLAYAVALLIALVLVQAIAGILANGLPAQAGNRDSQPPPKPFHGRASRTVANHIEGLAMFAPLAIICTVAGLSSPMSVLGAQIFFYSRAAHAALYLLGVPWLRAAAWGGGMVGTVMVLLCVLGVM